MILDLHVFSSKKTRSVIYCYNEEHSLASDITENTYFLHDSCETLKAE